MGRRDIPIPFELLFMLHFNSELALPEGQPTKKGGSREWQQCAPAMAAGVTDHIWRMENLLLFCAPPWHQPLPERRAA